MMMSCHGVENWVLNVTFTAKKTNGEFLNLYNVLTYVSFHCH